MKIIVSLCFFALAFFLIMFQYAGNHGHLMFRPDVTEDWGVWGLATILFLYGLVNLLSVKRVNKAQPDSHGD